MTVVVVVVWSDKQQEVLVVTAILILTGGLVTTWFLTTAVLFCFVADLYNVLSLYIKKDELYLCQLYIWLLNSCVTKNKSQREKHYKNTTKIHCGIVRAWPKCLSKFFPMMYYEVWHVISRRQQVTENHLLLQMYINACNNKRSNQKEQFWNKILINFPTQCINNTCNSVSSPFLCCNVVVHNVSMQG